MRTRSRGTAPSETSSTPSGVPQKSFLRRGSAAFAEAAKNQEEIERKKNAGGSVLRFYVKAGEECEIIVLDKSLDDCVAFYEHNSQDSNGKWGIYEPCLKDLGVECPICATGNNSYYVMMLSVLVLKEFTTKSGQVIKQSKMLLPIKMGQFDILRRLEAAAKKECGTMRGMYLLMARSKADKSPRIGEPAILDDGKMYDMLTEEELEDEYGHDAVVGQDKKTILRPENFDITPYDYEKLFPKPDIRAANGGKPPTGSLDEALGEFNESTGGESSPENEAAPRRTRGYRGANKVVAEEDAPATSTRRVRPNTAKAAQPEDDNPFTDDIPY